MKYEILYLGTNSPLIEYLAGYGSVDITDDRISPEKIKTYDWVVSYGYVHILKKEHLDAAKNPVLNLHISLLPWNRGASPNYWSWKENTPKGVSIHKIDVGLDTGPVYIQKSVGFEEGHTLATSYKKLKQEIEELFYEAFPKIISGNLKPTPQVGSGSFHYKKDLPKNIDWDTKVVDV